MTADRVIYGFVYLWYDRKRKMFYIGSHMGRLDDGYICSSDRMRHVYKRRPEDFKRRIIYSLLVNDRFVLLKEEQRWLNMMKEHEIRTKYYNLRKNASGCSPEQIREWWNHPERKAKHIESMSKAWTKERRQTHGEKIKAKWEDPDYLQKMEQRPKRSAISPEERSAISKRKKGCTYSDETLAQMSASAQKRANTAEHKERFSKIMSNIKRSQMPDDFIEHHNKKVSELVEMYGVNPSTIHRWRKRLTLTS